MSHHGESITNRLIFRVTLIRPGHLLLLLQHHEVNLGEMRDIIS